MMGAIQGAGDVSGSPSAGLDGTVDAANPDRRYVRSCEMDAAVGLSHQGSCLRQIAGAVMHPSAFGKRVVRPILADGVHYFDVRNEVPQRLLYCLAVIAVQR